jgi:hypothetical protein
LVLRLSAGVDRLLGQPMRRILEPLALKEVVSSVLGEAIWESSFRILTRYGPKDRIEDLLME